jgi:hypothetical protein
MPSRDRKPQLLSSPTQRAQDLSILYDVYDLKAHSKIKCDDRKFTVSELLDYGWTVDQIVKQKYI